MSCYLCAAVYQAFSRREANISLLDARAGSPSSAAEMLLRYRGNPERLDSALHDFERWTAELLESHISYPVLSYFRSQHDNQSWLAAITTILDTCALAMVGLKNLSPWQPQMTFAIARHAVVDLSQILKRPPRPPVPDRLPREDFLRLRAGLAGCALTEDAEAGYSRLAELRAMYEPYVNALSSYLAMSLPGWLPRQRVVHNWETSAWGRAASAAPVEDVHE
jgi:hypothetical protein